MGRRAWAQLPRRRDSANLRACRKWELTGALGGREGPQGECPPRSHRPLSTPGLHGEKVAEGAGMPA